MVTLPESPDFTRANASTVTSQLIVGGDLDTSDLAVATRQLEELVAAGVTHILDVRLEWTDAAFVSGLAPGLHYAHAGVDDAGQTIPGEWFDAVIEWALDALREPGHRVLVHCHMGVNRAPSTAFAILLAQGWEPVAALDVIHSARPIAYIAYAEDALRWHHERIGAPEPVRRNELDGIRAWRAEHQRQIIDAIRLLREADVVAEPADQPGAWLIRVDRAEAQECYRAWRADPGWRFTPEIAHADEIPDGDIAILWVRGPAGTEGVFGAGLVESTRPAARGTPARISITGGFVADWVLVPRTALEGVAGFEPASFEVFAKGDLPNIHPVGPGQAMTILTLAQAAVASR